MKNSTTEDGGSDIAADAKVDGAPDAAAAENKIDNTEAETAPPAAAETPNKVGASARDANQILSTQAMNSIMRSMPKTDLGFTLSPTTKKLLDEVQNFNKLLPDTESFTSTFRGMTGLEGILGDAAASSILSNSVLSTSFFDSVNMPAIASISEDTLSMLKGVESLGITSTSSALADALPTQTIMNSLLRPMESLISAQQLASLDVLGRLNTGFLGDLSWITDLTKGLELDKQHLPPNWRAVGLEPDDIEDDVRAILEEGIPLAWVPSGRVIEMLLAAPGAPARRRIISNNHRGILTHCERVIGRLPRGRALFYVDMIRKAILALRDGHVEASQALATNVLDTLVNQHTKDAFDVKPGVLTNPSSYPKFKKQSWRLTLAVHPATTVMRGWFTLDDRPGGYRRNATSHAITRHQYNRINAVLAIMNATSLLICFARDTPAFD
ncbi:hypothetical protein FHX49_000667 [Microbacterium endophyticum]|uniref:Uncharacterized protein n=1 Tax=Microbacterium endophyticum TaxID=1526412 RepID=A0A7W4V1J0_9MICO|nr:hypothetical protein [Microbacterium endophyticum]MBB2975126.1 hypothetical protein [Microbacterium endophyticum]NIK37334.1 hypothetical protein [Microbacterium endophyticum]